MNVIISPSAEREIKKLPNDIAKIILTKLFAIKDDPLSHVERLKGYTLWKLRIGDYRAILMISTKENTINIVKVGHRRNVYKKF